MTLSKKSLDIIANMPSLFGSGAIQAGVSGYVVWDEPGGDVIVEFAHEVPNVKLLPNQC